MDHSNIVGFYMILLNSIFFLVVANIYIYIYLSIYCIYCIS